MSVRFYTVVVDSHDPKQLAGWWAQVLDWKIVFEAPEEVVVAKDDDTYPALIFVPVPDSNTGNNRQHIDLALGERDEEIRWIEGLGSNSVDVGQSPDNSSIVRTVPEGNEF